jgi:hypothetical protein
MKGAHKTKRERDIGVLGCEKIALENDNDKYFRKTGDDD